MWNNKSNVALAELDAKVAAISRSQATIEFKLDGTVIAANENFLAAMGYTEKEIVGKHHRLFVDAKYAQSAEYRKFWEALNRGDYVSDKFRRVSKSGKDIWIQATYNPVLDESGKPVKVIKFATDVTATELNTKELEAKVAAISRSQGMIEFNLDGTVIGANANFLAVVGYSEKEIVGKHHRLFVDAAYAQSADYRKFWEALNRGEFISDKFRRISKSGKDVWIQASYNPLLDANGKPFKIVKFATDITAIENERRLVEEERAAKAGEQARVVATIGSGLEQLSDGNLTFRLGDALPGQYEQLRVNFNGAMDKLQDTLQGVVANAAAVRGGAAELAGASDDLSRRTEQQAAALEQTAAALSVITTTVANTSAGARGASETVGRARSEAEQSQKIVGDAVSAMRQIEGSSNEVSQIIGVIDEIAFQTNLLALNAGVEAARAGDSGRGFAVVASEVRALAQRSAAAAKEIKALISASSRQVEVGARLVDATGTALGRIVAQVNEINTLVKSIAAGAQEQAGSLGEVNSAIVQMDQTTQQNAAMVEQSTAAAHALSGEAESLAKLVGEFDLGQQTHEVIRSELKRVAPHAFRSATTTGRGGSSGAQPRPHTPKVAAVGTRGAGGNQTSDDGWTEF